MWGEAWVSLEHEGVHPRHGLAKDLGHVELAWVLPVGEREVERLHEPGDPDLCREEGQPHSGALVAPDPERHVVQVGALHVELLLSLDEKPLGVEFLRVWPIALVQVDRQAIDHEPRAGGELVAAHGSGLKRHVGDENRPLWVEPHHLLHDRL